ncbi:Long-chain-fatty-acid--CoA ligase [Peribacillus simplex]|uniref:class I adenylate-forming enzyme family protein n=1 Tax=Peribacillus simplex TaxID=1478 RepID=UPI001DBEA0C5|nr:class I adenylate-forming enzyme family protein [Peribacillus simplex]CAH0212887.1 Long-chain-fatty-acid--CoA ligase [Peribacillus simplex]
MENDQNLLTVYGLLERAVSANEDKEAIYDLKRRVSYHEMKKDVERLAVTLYNLGIKKMDRIAVSLPNWYETAVIFFAVAKIGAVLVPFNHKYRTHEVEYILKNSEPKALIVTEEFDQNFGIKEAQSIVPLLISVRFTRDGLHSYEDHIDGDVMEAEIDVNNDLFCILYTSGTTGVPKGVMITHRGVVQSANTLAGELRCTEKDVFVISAPLFHIFGMACNLFCGVSAGARMVLQEKYHPRETLQLIEQEKVTIKMGVPTMFIKEIGLEDFDSYDLSTLRTGMVGSAPIPPSKVKEIRDRLGIKLCQSYGITETVTVTMTPYDDDEQKITKTLGKPIPGVELKIVDENRLEIQSGETGEIALKSFGMMKGYYKMQEHTEDVLDREGWFYTGDLGVQDEEGYLHFVGRKKEMIIRGGYNIYPQEIESVLTKHPNIMVASVVGIPDEVLGEVVCAFIQLKKGTEITEEEIKSYVKNQIANYKVPGKVLFIEDFPMTASGKIQKSRLLDQLDANVSRPV